MILSLSLYISKYIYIYICIYIYSVSIIIWELVFYLTILFSAHETLSDKVDMRKWDINLFEALSCSTGQFLSTYSIYEKHF